MNYYYISNFYLLIFFPLIFDFAINSNARKVKRENNLNFAFYKRLTESQSSYKKLNQLKKTKIPLKNVDSTYWNGLNASLVNKKYPGIYFLDTYKTPSVPNVPPNSSLETTLLQLEQNFYKNIECFHIICKEMVRYGNLMDGGWEVCVTPPYKISSHSIVYSFGIGFDFSFDDDITARTKCHVYAFDPSMLVEDQVRKDNLYFYQVGLGSLNTVNSEHWKFKTFSTIKHLLKHHGVVIDLLKMDIEFDEWKCLKQMIADGSLKKVKQLIFEVHSPLMLYRKLSGNQLVAHFTKMLDVLQKLEESSFRRYFYHPNPFGKVPSIKNNFLLNCCYELYYVNIDFL